MHKCSAASGTEQALPISCRHREGVGTPRKPVHQRNSDSVCSCGQEMMARSDKEVERSGVQQFPCDNTRTLGNQCALHFALPFF